MSANFLHRSHCHIAPQSGLNAHTISTKCHPYKVMVIAASLGVSLYSNYKKWNFILQGEIISYHIYNCSYAH